MADFINPGAAATSALLQVLAEREAKRRQDMLDQITRANHEQDRPAGPDIAR